MPVEPKQFLSLSVLEDWEGAGESPEEWKGSKPRNRFSKRFGDCKGRESWGLLAQRLYAFDLTRRGLIYYRPARRGAGKGGPNAEGL